MESGGEDFLAVLPVGLALVGPTVAAGTGGIVHVGHDDAAVHGLIGVHVGGGDLIIEFSGADVSIKSHKTPPKEFDIFALPEHGLPKEGRQTKTTGYTGEGQEGLAKRSLSC